MNRTAKQGWIPAVPVKPLDTNGAGGVYEEKSSNWTSEF